MPDFTASGRTPLCELETVSGADFHSACAALDVGGRIFKKIDAELVDLNLKQGPIFYESCPLELGNRICRKRLEADGECPRCGVVVEGVPYVSLRKAKFVAADGTRLRLSALGSVAEDLVGATAARIQTLESEAVAARDAERPAQARELCGAFAGPRAMAIMVEALQFDQAPLFVSATVYAVGPKVAPAASEPTAKRSRTD